MDRKMKKLFKVSCTNCIIEAENDEQARIGFANYMQEIGIECFKVEKLSEEEVKQMNEEGADADWIA